MNTVSVKNKEIRLLGRMDRTQDAVYLDWTGSGFETDYTGSELWAELEAFCDAPDMYVSSLVEGFPVTRFVVEKGRKWYPLVHGLGADVTRRVALIKETQAMPDNGAAAVRVHALRFDGSIAMPPEPSLRIEFIGDSLTSGEGLLAPRGYDEWVPLFFSAAGGYAHICCRDLGAEYRILSQSGYGVNWDWQFKRENNMADGYTKIVGTQKGPEAEARGCLKPYDFSEWPADVVCIRLLSNDAGGMRHAGKTDALTEEATCGCVRFLNKVRACNPPAKIVWLVPDTSCFPEIGREAVRRCTESGMNEVYAYTLPDYTGRDLAARGHPNAEYNTRIGHELAVYLADLTHVSLKV